VVLCISDIHSLVERGPIGCSRQQLTPIEVAHLLLAEWRDGVGQVANLGGVFHCEILYVGWVETLVESLCLLVPMMQTVVSEVKVIRRDDLGRSGSR